MTDKTTSALLHPDQSAMREALDWAGKFRAHDPDPTDDHGPIYLVCPNGLMVNFSCDPRPGLDAKRVEWVADALNTALAQTAAPKPTEVPQPAPHKVTPTLVFEGGSILVHQQGHGEEDGSGQFTFDEDDLDYDGPQCRSRIAKVARSELLAIRDWLNSQFPKPTDAPSSEAGSASTEEVRQND